MKIFVLYMRNISFILIFIIIIIIIVVVVVVVVIIIIIIIIIKFGSNIQKIRLHKLSPSKVRLAKA